MKTQDTQRGFVLITSLIFLVVVTLLAVSAINNSTLQEKIATNTRARETAQQHANAALREAEALLGTQAFDTYQPAGTDVSLADNPGYSANDATPNKLKIWNQDAMLAGTSAKAFLDAAPWDDEAPLPIDYMVNDGDPETIAHYYVEELDGCYQADLDPDACATGRVIIYRITARAAVSNATVVTQSTFEKYY